MRRARSTTGNASRHPKTLSQPAAARTAWSALRLRCSGFCATKWGTAMVLAAVLASTPHYMAHRLKRLKPLVRRRANLRKSLAARLSEMRAGSVGFPELWINREIVPCSQSGSAEPFRAQLSIEQHRSELRSADHIRTVGGSWLLSRN
jgi:hypothetical protein